MSQSCIWRVFLRLWLVKSVTGSLKQQVRKELRATGVVACMHHSGENVSASHMHGCEPQHRGWLLVVRMSQPGEGFVFHSWPTRGPIK